MSLYTMKEAAPYYADYLPYYISFLAICSLYMVVGILLTPTNMLKQIYIQHINLTGPGARLWVPWMIISTAMRTGLILNFEDKGWYDATMITLLAALWYWNSEYWYQKTVLTSQYVTAITLDATAVVWMLLARSTVVAG